MAGPFTGAGFFIAWRSYMSDNPSRLYQAMLRRNMQGVTQPAQDASNDQGIFGDTIDLWQRG